MPQVDLVDSPISKQQIKPILADENFRQDGNKEGTLVYEYTPVRHWRKFRLVMQ